MFLEVNAGFLVNTIVQVSKNCVLFSVTQEQGFLVNNNYLFGHWLSINHHHHIGIIEYQFLT